MTYTLHDLAGFTVASALGVPVLLLPGFALAYAADFCGFRKADPSRRLLTAALVGAAVLPLIVALTARAAGVGAAVVVTLLIAVLGAQVARREPIPAIPRRAWIVMGIWLFTVAATWIDIDTGTDLHVSLLVVDMVKHAATVRVISDTGIVPPADVFFLRDQGASYYYYYFLVSALIERLGFGLVDARMAVAGQVVWTGVAVLGLAALLYEGIQSHRPRDARAAGPASAPLGLLALLVCVGGLQVLFVALRLIVNGQRVPQVTAALGEPITPFIPSLLWVPHHVSGVLTAWCAFLALSQAVQAINPHTTIRDALRRNAALLLFAAAALASSAGMTVWMTLGAAAIAATWAAVLTIERRWTALILLAAAGLCSVCLCAPDLIDMVRNRVGDQSPLGVFLRPVGLTDLMSWIVRLFAGDAAPSVLQSPVYLALKIALNPFSYLFEAGLFFIGAVTFWRVRARGAAWFRSETDRLLCVSSLVAFVLSTFIESTVLNNDFGWRVPLYWQLGAIVWTAYVIQPLWERTLRRVSLGWGWTGCIRSIRHVPASLSIILLLGISAVAYDVVGLRLYPKLGTEDLQHTEFDTDVVRDLRAAHEWLGQHASVTAVTQHNPEGHRALGFGLYGRQRVAIADKHNGTIFGASRDMVRARFLTLAPVFDGTLDVDHVKARLMGEKIDYVIVTSLDKPWQRQAPWVFGVKPMYASAHVRIIEVSRLQGALARADPPGQIH